MTEQRKNIYETRFRPLFKNEDYDGAFELLSENQRMEEYLSKKERIIMDSYKSKLNNLNNLLDKTKSILEESLKEFGKFRLELSVIKFEWEHRN